jgi:hypothetical protein
MTIENAARVLPFLVAASCASASTNRLPLDKPLWSDPDRNDVPTTPARHYSGLLADGADQILFRQMSEALAFRQPGEARNVNSLDEVPSSSWFENRIGLLPMTPEELAQGPCARGPTLDSRRGPWRVTSAKPDGTTAGFFVTAPDGQRYLLKTDSPDQPEQATAADVVGSKLYWAAGYFTPCNQVVTFPESLLVIDRGATRKDDVGQDVPLTAADVKTMLAAAIRLPDGNLRASASRFVSGVPKGPFRYEDTRADDPNDVVPHQDRRELRAGRLFASWINHWDAREQNTLDVWMEEGGRRYLRHYLVDWGDALGGIWMDSAKEELSRRIGHAGYLDWDQVTVDLVTLGLWPRPWRQAQRTASYKTFGYFTSRDFDPAAWRAGYPNPAFERMTTGDALWGARILARISDQHVRAAVAAARFSNPADAQYLERTLIERRNRILQHYLAAGSPLTRFMLVRRTPGELPQSLCFEDDAIRMGVADAAATRYRVRALAGDRTVGSFDFRPDAAHPHRSCVRLPVGDRRPSELAGASAPDDHPARYQIVEIASGQGIIRAHLYDLGPQRGYQLVGLQRRAAGEGW